MTQAYKGSQGSTSPGALRRDFFSGALGVGAAMALSAGRAGHAAAAGARVPLAAPVPMYVYVGTYTTNNRADGIYVHRMDPETGTLTPLHTITGVENPSFLAFDREQRFLYAVNEIGNYEGTTSGSVTAYAIDPATGNLSFLNRQSSHGAIPAHLNPDAGNTHLLVANYNGNNVVAYRREPDGRLGDATDLALHQGSGPNAARQERPHPHSVDVDPSGRYALVCDLGTDRVMIYRFDAESGRFDANWYPSAQVSSGAGPRHLAFHPSGRYVYVINELDSTISVFSWDARRGVLQSVQTVPTLPADFTAVSNTAEVAVHPSGRFVYGSNRGHDSIAMFAVNEANGKLTSLGYEPTQGQTPRNFAIEPSGTFLFAANQGSNTIVPFRIAQDTGRLTPTGRVSETKTPVCLIFRPA